MDDLEDLSRRAAVTQNQIDPARQSSPPWFVGNGRGAIAFVLWIVIVALILRAVTLWWLADEAWSWASEQPSLLALGLPPKVPLPHRPIPVAMKTWVTPADHPQQRLADDPHYPMLLVGGTTIVTLAVGSDGRVSDCWTGRSSGSLMLDDAACMLIKRRARFLPARKADGSAAAAIVSERVTWPTPRRAAVPLDPGDRMRIFAVTSVGKIARCQQWIDGRPVDRPDCSNAFTDDPAVRRALAKPGTVAIVGRTRVAVADTAQTLPPPFSPPRPDRTPIHASRERAVIERDGRLTHCTVDRAPDPVQLTGCEIGAVVSLPDSADMSQRHYLSIDDRITAVRRVRSFP